VLATTECAELVAVEVCLQAQDSGREITMNMIERALQQFRAHQPACRCRVCEAAAMVSAADVYLVVSSWPRRPPRRRARATH
jgi:hypothetical protein